MLDLNRYTEFFFSDKLKIKFIDINTNKLIRSMLLENQHSYDIAFNNRDRIYYYSDYLVNIQNHAIFMAKKSILKYSNLT